MIVVADTSPINYLVLIGHIDLLGAMYKRVLIPLSVWQELQDQESPESVRAWTASPPIWLELREVDIRDASEIASLDPGELEAIALAREVRADFLIVDELDARREAIRLSLPVIGTLGVLRAASQAGLISLSEAISKLLTTSFFASTELIRSILEGGTR
jgi:predicted nucleic acid-binding protein